MFGPPTCLAPRPQHLHHERTHHGAFVRHVRVGKGPHISLKAAYGPPEFDDAHRAALAGGTSPTATGTFARSLDRDRDSQALANWFRELCDAAVVKGSAHGLRKLGATRAADNGATEAQLEAIFGWRGGGMASIYTRAANRRKLAVEAVGKMVPQEQTAKSCSRPLPEGAGAKSKK